MLASLFGPLINAFSSFKESIALAVEKKVDNLYAGWGNISKVLFTNLFILIFSIFLIMFGLMLLPVTVIIFWPWENHQRLAAGIIISLAYILVGIGAAVWMFEKNRWKKAFGRKKCE